MEYFNGSIANRGRTAVGAIYHTILIIVAAGLNQFCTGPGLDLPLISIIKWINMPVYCYVITLVVNGA